MSIGGTRAHNDESDLPPLVDKAVRVAHKLGFECSCLPAQGRLLQLLAAGVRHGVIGETGTGCGVGLAWMASGTDPATRLVSVEADPTRATAASEIFEELENVTVLCGPWRAILEHGPFDLLVLDGGGTGKPAEIDPAYADPGVLLLPGGTVVIDDFPPSESPPPHHRAGIEAARTHWLEHPELRATEIRPTPTMSTVLGTRIAAAPPDPDSARSTVTLRRAGPGDVAECTEIVRGLRAFFTDDVPDKVVNDLRAHEGWVLAEEHCVLGFAVVERRSRAAEILWMAVRHDRRGCGFGTAILDHLLRGLSAEGVQFLEVKTLDRSADYEPYVATRAFWEHHDFVQVDTIDPYPGWQPGTPAAIYVRTIDRRRPHD